MPGELEIRVLGDLAVLRGGESVPLPPSRKTRALLAYLAVVDRPQRRERLCEMFWEIPDDPRGALRWSLSKIRQILSLENSHGLHADRNTVHLARDGIDLDVAPLLKLGLRDVDGLETELLEDLAARFRGDFLEGMSLPRCPEFDAWRIAIADEIEVLRRRILRLLMDRLGADPARALPHAHALHALSPDDPELAGEVGRLADAARHAVTAARPGREVAPRPGAAPEITQPSLTQEIRNCTTRDGVRIAYALSGQGPPLVKAANWLSHLEHDWDSPIWKHWIEGLSARNLLVRYDERGNGLSDWDAADLSFEAMIADLESIVDAAGLRRFCLLGLSQGCAISVAYAVRHPERVSGLILYGGYAKGWRARGNEEEIRRREAIGTLMRQGWGQQNPMFRQLFTSMFVPGASQQQMDWFNELQRITISPENAVRLHEAFGDIDVSGLLSRVSAPTLVLHARDDAVISFAAGQALAEGIPGARFVPLDSSNHIMLETEPAFGQFLDEVQRFVVADVERVSGQAAPELHYTRRQVTVLAAEVISPIQAFDSLDPEAAMRELAPCLDRLVETIESHHGQVSVSGDGSVTAIFGLTHVTEDHAFLACRASLAGLSSVTEASRGSCRLRVGLDTGDVVVRQRSVAGLTIEALAGAIPRQAGRIMRALRRAGIAMTARTRAAAGGYIQAARMSAADLPHLGRHERIWELVGENRALSRWHLRANRGLTCLIGRSAELGALRSAWRRVREGHGQVMAIVADPGLGKSRLVHEFISDDEVARHAVLESGALEFDANIGFQVARKLVRAACGIEDGLVAREAQERLERRFAELELDARLLAPLRFLVELPVDDPAWTSLESGERRVRVGESVRALLTACSRQSPLVLLIEDLHWIDAESETIIQRLAETITPQRIFLILTYRSGNIPGWTSRSSYQQIRLEPFDSSDTGAFLDSLMGTDPSLDHLKPLLARRSESTPLFLEESVRALAAKGKLVGEPGAYRAPGVIDDIAIPDTVRSVIAARIDQLPGQEHSLLQVAAVIGRDVPDLLLRTLSGLGQDAFEAAIRHLQELEFLFEVKSFPSVEYTFKHALTHDVAYATLIGEERRSMHRAALRAMEELYRDGLGEHVERLADHALRAEDWASATAYLIQATDRATEHSAYDRAAKFLEHARQAVDALPPSARRLELAIDVRTRMRPVYEAIGAFANAVEPLAEACVFADELGDRERLCQILVHQSYLNSAHGRIEEALEATERLRQLVAGEESDRHYACEADLAAAQALLMRADAQSALELLRPHYLPFTTDWRHVRFGQLGTRAVWYLGHLAQAEASLGRFDAASEAAEEALRIAEEVRRPVDLCAARYFGALVAVLRGPSVAYVSVLREMTAAGAAPSMRPWLLAVLGHAELLLEDYEAAAATLEAAITEAERFDVPQFECYARALLACARSRLGEPEAAANLEYSLIQARAREDRWTEIIVLRALAEQGNADTAISRLTEACALAEANGYAPELARCLSALGQIELESGHPSAAATLARSAELWATMGLSIPAAGLPTSANVVALRSQPQAAPRPNT